MSDAKKKAIKYIILVIAIVGAIPAARYGYIEYKRYTITKQWQKNIELYKRGIKQNIPLAMYGLGYAYHTGHGVEKNHQKARELYQQAADRGEALAQYNLGFMCRNGEGGVIPPLITAVKSREFKQPKLTFALAVYHL